MSVEEVHDHEEQNLSDPLVRTLPLPGCRT
jgi:hypothetical protein